MDLKEEISKVAYEIFIKSGCIPGRDMDNWLEAERIVYERYKALEVPPAEETEKPKKTASVKKKTEPKAKTSSTSIKKTTPKKEPKQTKK